MSAVTRFAPSPTGYLHAGNGIAALLCQQWAQAHQAFIWLRIEDIDHTRCRKPYIEAIREDLRWLGFHWHQEAPLQSQRTAAYDAALTELRQRQLIYPCFCSRSDFRQQAPADGDWQCPGRCALLDAAQAKVRMRHQPCAWRLHRQRALDCAGQPLYWQDMEGHQHTVSLHDDPVIGRKDIRYSYHLAVVIDDAAQGISHVIRGMDLLPHTAIHRLLQALLGYPAPLYAHHPLLTDSQGQRLAKTHVSTALRQWRQQGMTGEQARARLWQWWRGQHA